MSGPQTLAASLGGHKVGNSWIARCPAHNDRRPSLSIRDAGNGRVLVHCHAGCSQVAVISTLRARGLWSDKGPRHRPDCWRQRGSIGTTEDKDANRTGAALHLWTASEPAEGTLVETYLRSRGLTLTPPKTLRFHAALRHPSGRRWPAMIALVTHGIDNRPLAVHRTFVARDGSGKAPFNPTKMMRGPCRGGAVRLGKANNALMVGEGIETCLAAMQATGQPAWAALSTSGLRSLDLPHTVVHVVVLADGDDPGEIAACESARRWAREGRRVRIARPPRGKDFNDLLLGSCERDPQGRGA